IPNVECFCCMAALTFVQCTKPSHARKRSCQDFAIILGIRRKFSARKNRLLRLCSREGEGVGLVRAEGLEPPRLAAAGPKPAASANSATPAGRTGAFDMGKMPRGRPQFQAIAL